MSIPGTILMGWGFRATPPPPQKKSSLLAISCEIWGLKLHEWNKKIIVCGGEGLGPPQENYEI